MINSLCFSCLAATLAASTLGLAAPLTMKAKKGDVHKYHVVASLTLNGSAFKISNDETDTVTFVDSKGNITLSETETNMTVEAAGQKFSPPAAPARTHYYRPDGTFISPNPATEDSKSELRAENLQTVKLPASTLSAGKTWSWEVASDAKTGAVKLHVAYKVLASEKVAGMECWKVSLNSKELAGATPASVAGVIWIRKTDALTARMKIEFKNYPLPGAPAPASGSVDQEILR